MASYERFGKGTVNTLVVVAIVVLRAGTALGGVSYQDPDGGWLYKYEGDQADNDEMAALDGGWTHELNDRWDGSAPGEAGSSPGGIGVFTEGDVKYLRIQDAGNPADLGIDDAISNRKMTLNRLIHDLDGVSTTYLDDGFTFSFRARLATTGPLDDMTFGGSQEPWPEEGRGYDIDFDGTGFWMMVQRDGIAGNLAFSLADAEYGLEDLFDAPDSGGLIMNNLVDDIPAPDVDTHEVFDEANLFPIEDLTTWHEFWITIQEGGEGTHQVDVYADGSTVPTTFDVTLGSANREETFHMGPSYTSGATAVDVDFLAFSEGVLTPQSTGGLPALRAGDADQDLDFDQLDLVQVQIASKYLSGQPATWGEGDWDGAPGGAPGSPPPGNGFFDQLDIIAALSAGTYLKGPYAELPNGGGGPAMAALAGPGTAIPEPATALLFAVGLAFGLVHFRRINGRY